MSEAICDPRYWARRFREAPSDQPHHAIFKCDKERWRRIERKHEAILAATIGCHESILDAGCGWGRLLTLLPGDWFGYYVGLDISPTFIDKAQSLHRHRHFQVSDLRTYREGFVGEPDFDWGVLISIRPMMKRHLGEEEWQRVEVNLRRVCRKLLYLEYDENDPGSVEAGTAEVTD